MFLFNRKIFKEEDYKKALKLIEELVKKSQAEKGCIVYKAFRDIDNKYGLCIYEEWDSKESLEAHQSTEHFKRIVPQISEIAYERSPLYRFEDLD